MSFENISYFFVLGIGNVCVGVHVLHVPFNELVSTYFLNGCLCSTLCALMLPHDWLCVCVFMHSFLNECVNNELGFSV